MLDKDLYDWSFFTAGESALDLLGHLARWGLKVGIEPKKKWRARALTDLQEMNALQAQGIDAANSPGSANTRYWLKARILGDNSPHNFIPDPCDPAYASDLDYVYKLISMHTTFISVEKTIAPVTRGDIISVELNVSNDRYELQYGKYRKLLSIEDPPDNLKAECASLVKLFGKITHKKLPDRSSSAPNRVASGTGYSGGTAYDSADCNQFNLKSNYRKIPKFTLAELEKMWSDGVFTDLLSLIHEGESRTRNYSAANLGLAAGTKHSDGTRTSQKTIVSNIPGRPSTDDLTKITIGRIKNAGKKCRSLSGRECWDQYGSKKEHIIFAAGRYQIIPGTLLSLLGKNAKAMGIATPVYPNSQLFDEKTQDILAIIGLMARRPAIGLYLTGMMDQPCSAIMELAAEWASFPLPIDRGKCKKGQSYYCGGSDKAAAGHTLGAIETILANTRRGVQASSAYASALSAGRVGPTGA